MTELVVQPIGGLCNRLRVVDAAITFGQSTGREVHIVWQANDDCNAPFLSLFEPSNRFSVIETKPPRAGEARYSINNYDDLEDPAERESRRSVALERDIHYRFYYRDFGKFRGRQVKLRFDALDEDRTVYVATASRFVTTEQFGQHYTPVEEIRETINGHTRQFDNNTIGVHIRRGDHVKAIAASPLQMFIDAMRDRIEINPNANFFLATDDEGVDEEIKTLFPGIVSSHDKTYGRDIVDGIKDGIVDLYCLAATNGVIGTVGSSYSLYGAKLGGLALISPELEQPEPA